jgi:hypothetical protein
MVDTARTLAALQALLADNTSGDISPQDVRDFLLSVFPQTAQGDIAVLDGASLQTRLAVGAPAKFLQSDGSDPFWVWFSGDATVAVGGALTVSGVHSGSAHHIKYTDGNAVSAVTGQALHDGFSDSEAAEHFTKAAVGHAIVFAFPDESLSAAVFLPRPSWMLLDKLPAPTDEANQRFTVTAGTAGASTNTVVLESTTTNPFTGSPSWTIQATAALNALKFVEVDGVFTSDWVWDPATEYLRVRCTVVNATAPKDVQAVFDYD